MQRLMALLLAGILAGTGLSAALLGSWRQDPLSETTGGHRHVHAAHGSGPADMQERPTHTHFREGEPGHVPTRDEARQFRLAFSSVTIHGDSSFRKLGWIKGSGTERDPFVIENVFVERNMDLRNFGQHLVIRGSWIGNQLRLNYLGDNVYVHHNSIHDLRINENVKRVGANTGGLLEHNAIALIGQMRHTTGEFRFNTVGPRPEGLDLRFLADTGEQSLPADVVWNFDGFHGASVHDNDVKGFVDIKLHGHNHGSCLACPIHHHGVTPAPPEHDPGDHEHATAEEGGVTMVDDHAECAGCAMAVDHTVRFHSLDFYANTIEANGVALRYNDRNHAGDDRQADSEKEESLDDPHVHAQRIAFERNVLRGALFIDVFYAKDELHEEAGEGVVVVRGNDVTIPYGRSGLFANGEEFRGIIAHAARFLQLQIEGNVVRFEELPSDDPLARLQKEPRLAGMLLAGFARSDIAIVGNTVENGDVGAKAREFAESVRWRVVGNDFRTTQDVDADESVESRPGA